MLLSGIRSLVEEDAFECLERLLYIQVTGSNLGIGIWVVRSSIRGFPRNHQMNANTVPQLRQL